MKSSITPRSLLLAAGAAVLLSAPLSASWAGGTRAGMASPDAAARYKMEREKCLSGRSHQDRTTCLTEARNAYAEARKGQLDNGVSEEQRMANRMLRCRVQPPQDRAECERMARGEGIITGSVEGGGVIRELVTRVDAPPTR